MPCGYILDTSEIQITLFQIHNIPYPVSVFTIYFTLYPCIPCILLFPYGNNFLLPIADPHCFNIFPYRGLVLQDTRIRSPGDVSSFTGLCSNCISIRDTVCASSDRNLPSFTDLLLTVLMYLRSRLLCKLVS